MVLFSIAEPFSIGKQTPIWHEKRSTLWPENKFFKSNMDALTVLSICNTGLVLLVRAEKQCAVWLHCLVFTTLIIWLSILHIIFGIGVEEEGV